MKFGDLKLDFTVKADTPWLIGGADQKSPEFRVPSLRGVMRYWFRAAACGFADLKKVSEKEGELFGSTEKISSFRVMVHKVEKTTHQTNIFPHRNGSNPPANGLFPCSATLSILFRPGTAIADKDAIRATLKLVSLLGGIGKRSRRGLGSFAFEDLIDPYKIAEKVDEQLNLVGKLFGNGAFSAKPASYPILSRSTASIWRSKSSFNNEVEARKKLMEICHSTQPKASKVFGYAKGNSRLASRIHFRVHSSNKKDKQEYFAIATWFRVEGDEESKKTVTQALTKDFEKIWETGASA